MTIYSELVEKGDWVLFVRYKQIRPSEKGTSEKGTDLFMMRSMKRLWENDSQTVGVATRREKEAVYFEEALKCSCWK